MRDAVVNLADFGLSETSPPPPATSEECGHPLDTGHPGGHAVLGADEANEIMRSDSYDVELLLSFGRGYIASAGHIAVCIRDGDQERVFSANFYADGAHNAADYCTSPLVIECSRSEYLWATESPLPNRCFGTDYGELYARNVLGVRFTGVPASSKSLMREWAADQNQQHEQGELVYGYTGYNCAFVAGSMLRAAGVDIPIVDASAARCLSVGALSANIPMQITIDAVKWAQEHSVGVHSCLYHKYAHSTFAAHDAPDTQYKDFLNRFPTFRSFDFMNEQENYEAWHNLHAMHLFHRLRKWTVQVDDEILTLRVEQSEPERLAEALTHASQDADAEAKNVVSRLVRLTGFKATASTDLNELYWE